MPLGQAEGVPVRSAWEHTFAIAHPPYLREKARRLRSERHLSIDEIAERLALPKTTIFFWVRDLPLGRPVRAGQGQRLGNRRMVENHRRRREGAYAAGRKEFTTLSRDPTFRDFVCLYIAEGYKRRRGTVSLCNSDPRVVELATRWMRRITRRPLAFAVQYHPDQDPDELRRFWGATLRIDPAIIRMYPKSNSGQLARRTWRCQHGVLAVSTHDTLFRARLQGWMDRLQEAWLDSGGAGRGATW